MSRKLNREEIMGDRMVSAHQPHLACALLLDVSEGEHLLLMKAGYDL